jgi:hypothetical protein
MSSDDAPPVEPIRARVLFAIRESEDGQLLVQSSVSPLQLLELLTNAIEDVRYQAYEQRQQESKVKIIGQISELLKVRR